MELYDEKSLQESIEAGERRLAQARQRRRRNRRRAVFGVVLAVFVVGFGALALQSRGQAPSAPLLVVTWPKPKVEQSLASGQTVSVRSGQPFTVSVTDAEKWDITWKSGEITGKGSQFSWSSSDGAGRITATCRPRAGNWTDVFAWSQPSSEVHLQSVQAQTPPGANTYARRLKSDAGAWIYPNIFARGEVAWDERALPFLAEAPPGPSADLASQLASVGKTPVLPQWRLVSDFEGNARISDEGTFASLRSDDIENQLPALAAQIVNQAPDASVKFVMRLDKTPPQGIVRLAFDGKRERRAWVRRAGDNVGKPFTGWENGTLTAVPLAVAQDD